MLAGDKTQIQTRDEKKGKVCVYDGKFLRKNCFCSNEKRNVCEWKTRDDNLMDSVECVFGRVSEQKQTMKFITSYFKDICIN